MICPVFSYFLNLNLKLLKLSNLLKNKCNLNKGDNT